MICLWDFLSKKFIMNIDIKTIGLIIVIAITASFFTLRNNYVLEIESLTNKISDLKKENDTLYMKLELITKTFEDLKPKKNHYVSQNKEKVKVITKIVEIKREITGMEKFEKVMDSIKTTLPNRTGQDLINSLKMKTEI